VVARPKSLQGMSESHVPVDQSLKKKVLPLEILKNHASSSIERSTEK
jgi:hypothetical protein